MAEATKKTLVSKPVLARASEATDPAVHHLLAELQSARMNDDADAVATLTSRLADLGYE